MNAFELISRSHSFSLENMFEKQKGIVKRETSFASLCPANEIMSKIEETAKPMGFNVHKRNYKMKLQGDKTGRKGHLAVATEVFEVAPSLHMVELRKTGGDTLEFHNFYKNFSSGLKDIASSSSKSLVIVARNLAFESTFLTTGRVLSIRRTRLTLASLEMCMRLKDHLDAQERKQHKSGLESPIDFEEEILDAEVQQNEAIPLSEEEIAIYVARGEGTMSGSGSGGEKVDYDMTNYGYDDYE
nr:CBL-interacting serine/threonine-protein kinase 9-like isoform X1 [Tanacetum cinerariifolium]